MRAQVAVSPDGVQHVRQSLKSSRVKDEEKSRTFIDEWYLACRSKVLELASSLLIAQPEKYSAKTKTCTRCTLFVLTPQKKLAECLNNGHTYEIFTTESETPSSTYIDIYIYRVYRTWPPIKVVNTTHRDTHTHTCTHTHTLEDPV